MHISVVFGQNMEANSDLHVTGVKVECVDPSYDLTSTIKFEETPVPITFSVVKCEAERHSNDTDTIDRELNLQVTTEENEISAVRTWNCRVTDSTDDPELQGATAIQRNPSNSAEEEELYRKILSLCSVDNSNYSTTKDNVQKTAAAVSVRGPFICNICGKSQRTAYLLQIHVNRHETEKSVCEICGKLHLRTHREGEPFKCQLCMKEYKVKSSLKDHMRTHTGEQPYKCDVCGRRFPYAQSLRCHIRMHKTLLKCHICGKSFRTPDRLHVHVLQHSGMMLFKCNICGKGLATVNTLRVHVRKHSGDKPFICNVCGNGLTSKVSLEYHLRTHSGEKPFKCEECGRCFTGKRGLKTHKCTPTPVRL
ncbi:zinc finger protein 235-like isoform X2 [Periplaneta americana]|uniref:zinc finger protein 235-like isoform X2 n=1 Tax=Periplaneta americana TaxID=6978 RepID=UPI0037E71D9C